MCVEECASVRVSDVEEEQLVPRPTETIGFRTDLCKCLQLHKLNRRTERKGWGGVGGCKKKKKEQR